MRPHSVFVAACIYWSLGIAGVDAHDLPAPENTNGYPIPAIDHGAMEAIAPFEGRIISLARTVEKPSQHLHALLLHNEIQRANCLWYVIPGSITDEINPLNGCAHAGMAGLREILSELIEQPETHMAATAIVSDLDYEMVLLGSSFIKCSFSADTFNTASQIRPNWGEVLIYLSRRFWPIGAAVLTLLAATGMLGMSRARKSLKNLEYPF